MKNIRELTNTYSPFTVKLNMNTITKGNLIIISFQNGLLVFKLRNDSLSQKVVQLNPSRESNKEKAEIICDKVVTENLNGCTIINGLSVLFPSILFNVIIEGNNMLYHLHHNQ